MNLAPRKPDWDLKRDVAKKLEKLERRTQRAIAALIRKSSIPRQATITVFQTGEAMDIELIACVKRKPSSRKWASLLTIRYYNRYTVLVVRKNNI